MGRDKMIGHRGYVDGMGNIKRKRHGNTYLKVEMYWNVLSEKKEK